MHWDAFLQQSKEHYAEKDTAQFQAAFTLAEILLISDPQSRKWHFGCKVNELYQNLIENIEGGFLTVKEINERLGEL